MKIGILSDTHTKIKRAKDSIDKLLNEGAEFLVHAGDVCEEETLELLKNSGKHYVCVYGNNDAHLVALHNKYNLVQEPHYFKLANTKFKLMHLPYYMSADAEVVLYGHTHQFKSEFINGTLFLNPGESCARNKALSECALLEIEEKKFNVTYYSKGRDEEEFYAQEFTYDRKVS
ncbi:MAG: YfcE family phosphodiesterase [Campylobacterales bacterium]|nr:YfcE family phosphodiesterase [Campylobacterales bacterium]